MVSGIGIIEPSTTLIIEPSKAGVVATLNYFPQTASGAPLGVADRLDLEFRWPSGPNSRSGSTISRSRDAPRAPSRLWTAGCSNRGGRVLCAGGSRRGPGPRSEAAAVGKVARNPRRVCIAVRRSQRTLADLIAGWIRQPGPAQWLRGAPFFL